MIIATQSQEKRAAEWERAEALPAAERREQEQVADHKTPRDGHFPWLGHPVRHYITIIIW